MENTKNLWVCQSWDGVNISCKKHKTQKEAEIAVTYATDFYSMADTQQEAVKSINKVMNELV